jgi:hypothetical protein
MTYIVLVLEADGLQALGNLGGVAIVLGLSINVSIHTS